MGAERQHATIASQFNASVCLGRALTARDLKTVFSKKQKQKIVLGARLRFVVSLWENEEPSYPIMDSPLTREVFLGAVGSSPPNSTELPRHFSIRRRWQNWLNVLDFLGPTDPDLTLRPVSRERLKSI